MALRWLVLALAVLLAPPAAAQLAPRERSTGQCRLAVAFEHLTIRTLVGITNYYHAVVVIGGPQGTAFEGNPTGGFPNWGTLGTRQRTLARQPLKDGHIFSDAGLVYDSCERVVARAQAVAREVAAARLPYAPAPELVWNRVNSNSFAYYLVGKLGQSPPPAPWPPASGWVPGYHDAIID